MIPTVVARQTRETVLDYLRTTSRARDELVVCGFGKASPLLANTD